MQAVYLDGQLASAGDLATLAQGNYGHFSSMQVRGGAVQGLALHLDRLQSATTELFDAPLPPDRVRSALAHVAALHPDCSLRITVHARRFDLRQPRQVLEPDVLAWVGPAAQPRSGHLRVRSVEFQRALPHIKHVGTFPLFHQRRQAIRAGYDDALFVDGAGRISEGSFWNVGFWDGGTVVWPEAPALRGTTEQLLQAGLREAGLAQCSRELGLEEAGRMTAAFACNAGGVAGIASLDGVDYPGTDGLMPLLAEALATRPWEPVRGL